jgi:hypothetical protein
MDSKRWLVVGVGPKFHHRFEKLVELNEHVVWRESIDVVEDPLPTTS